MRLHAMTGAVVAWWLALCLAVWAPLATASPVSLTDADPALRDLAAGVTLIEDPERRLTVADVQHPEAPWQALRTDQHRLQFGFSPAAIWLRVTLRNDTRHEQARIVEIDFPLLSEVALYVPDGAGTRTLTAGRAQPFEARAIRSRLPTFRVTVPAWAEQTLYLRVASIGPLNIPLRLWLPEAHQAKERYDYSMQSWYFGVAAAMILFNLFLLVALRDPVYFYYVVFVTIGVISLAAQNGMAHEFLWPAAAGWNDVSQLVGFCASLASLLLFMRVMLSTRRVVPALDRLLSALLWGNLTLAAIIGLGQLPLARLANLVYLLTMSVVVLVSIACALKRERAAYFFIAAFAMLMAGVLVTVLRNFGLLPDNALTLYSLQLGSIFEMLLLALALADRFRVMRRAIDEAQGAAMAAQQALVTSLQLSERELEQRVAERTAALATSQRKLQEIVDTALDAVVRVDAQSRIIGWNRQAELIFGLPTEQALGANLSETIIPERYRAAHESGMARFIATRQSQVINRRIEMAAINAQGREFPIELAITRVSLDDPNAFEFCAFIRDISARKEAEEEVRLSLQKQTELNNLKARFVTMASHEFRTPLASILSSAELLEHYGARMPDEDRTALFQTIGAAVRRMARMLEDVLIIGRSDAGRLEFKPVTLALPSLVQAVVDELHAAFPPGETTPELSVTITDDAREGIFDEHLLRHIIANLLSNAIKYSPTGGRVELVVCRREGGFEFMVSDQGIGIPEADLPGLFESFSRASNVGTIQGTGLGLAIVKRSVDRHEGTIAVHSTLGQGTRFTVWLPQPAR